jgi:hypothetical protein
LRYLPVDLDGGKSEVVHRLRGAGRQQRITTIEGIAMPTARCTPFRKPSGNITASSAASARRG